MRPVKSMVGRRVKAIIDTETRDTKTGILSYNKDYECFTIDCGQVTPEIVEVYEHEC